MFSYGWISDRHRVVDTLTHPALWPWISFDGDTPEDVPFPEHAAFLGAWDGDEYLGMYTFEAISSNAWRAHVHLLPNARGKALGCTKGALQWLADHLPNLNALIGETPSQNRLAVAFKTKLGFREIGIIKDAVTQNGTLQDLVISEYRMR